MPFKKLVKLKRFSKLRIKQLWDDCRIFAAWYSSTKRGMKIFDKKTKKEIRLPEIVRRYAHARGLLMALGYVLKRGYKPAKTTPEFKEMFRRALPAIKYYYSRYKGKVARS